jgi:hypothetical protein
MRNSSLFLLFTAAGTVLLGALLLHGRYVPGEAVAARTASAEIVARLQLTDLCLFTEARYTRHPAMTDLHSAFQDHPMALEHFPSGSLVTPPRFHPGAP